MREEFTPRSFGIGRLFHTVRDAVVVADGRGRIELWNPAAERMFGYTAAEAIGQNVSIIVPPSLRARHERGMEHFRATGTGPLIESGAVLELPARRKDGTMLVIEMTLSKAEGYVMAILRDVTERVRLREASENDRARLREANEALESFAYVVGHDLKEPVRAMDAYLEALGERELDADARELLETARHANRQLASLLLGLIDWSRASVSGPELAPLDVRRVVLGACAPRYQRALEERGGKLDVADGFRPVLATEGLLCQLFGNLILNAVEHNGGAAPRVEVVPLGEDGQHLVVAVRDNGPGFPPDVLERLRQRGAARPLSTKGGFGMIIAMRAAQALGGRIEIGDVSGGGAEVRVWLKLA